MHAKHAHAPRGGPRRTRGRRDCSRCAPRPGRPHFSNFGPPAERSPGGGGGGGGLRCAEPTYFSRVDPKVPHFSRKAWRASGHEKGDGTGLAPLAKMRTFNVRVSKKRILGLTATRGAWVDFTQAGVNRASRPRGRDRPRAGSLPRMCSSSTHSAAQEEGRHKQRTPWKSPLDPRWRGPGCAEGKPRGQGCGNRPGRCSSGPSYGQGPTVATDA